MKILFDIKVGSCRFLGYSNNVFDKSLNYYSLKLS